MKTRVLSYDVFRGVLLVAMVGFHIVVNFTSWGFDQRLFYWVPVGFMMFLGVVLAKFLSNRVKKKVALAAKLLGIFLLGNVVGFWHGRLGIMDIVVGKFSVVSFEILLPMAVVILLSIALDRLKDGTMWLGLAVAGLVSVSISGWESYNLLFVFYGAIGYFMGRAFEMNDWVENRLYLGPAVVAAVIPFFLVGNSDFLNWMVAGQAVGMYLVSNFCFKDNRILASLGRHSLMLYVAHIVIIRAIVIYL